MSMWQALKPGWRSGLNALQTICVLGVLCHFYPTAAFAAMAVMYFVTSWLSGAQSDAIGKAHDAAKRAGLFDA